MYAGRRSGRLVMQLFANFYRTTIDYMCPDAGKLDIPELIELLQHNCRNQFPDVAAYGYDSEIVGIVYMSPFLYKGVITVPFHG